MGCDRGGQHAIDGHDRPIEAQLAQDTKLLHFVRWQHTHGGQHPQRNGQVKVAAFLGHVCGRQINCDAPGRQRQANRTEGPAHAFF